MKQETRGSVLEHVRTHRWVRKWYRLVSCLAAVVVFCTTYALILPAITMESYDCTLQEHTHTVECYTQVTSITKEVLSCTTASLEAHEHTDLCYNEDGTRICGDSDFFVHTHNESCYDAAGDLRCTLPEIKERVHTDECYVVHQGELCCQDEEHEHTEECYEQVRELICEKEEIELHEHTDECFDEAGNWICGKVQMLEHVHTEDCVQTVEKSVDTEALNCTLPEDENHTHGPLCYGTWVLNCEQEEHTHGVGCVPEPKKKLGALNYSARSTELPLNVTKVEGSGTVYDETQQKYKTDLQIAFQLDKKAIVAGEDGGVYVFTYPKEVLVPGGLFGQVKDLYDGNQKKVGTYTFVKNPDGTSSVQVKIDQSYLANAGETIDGHISFEGTLSASSEDNGSVVIPFGDGNLKLEIPGDQITYPGGETDRYDINTSKSGQYSVEGNKLTYTVYVRSIKGTPDNIHLTDKITPDNLELGNPTVKVEQGTYNYHNPNHMPDNNDWTTVNVSHTYKDGEISMDLPGLKKPQEMSGYKKCNCYKITYTYDILSQNIAQAMPENNIIVKAKDDKTNQEVTDKDKAVVTIDKTLKVSKGGNYQEKDGRIEWTITVNPNGANIAGAKLTDEMLGQISEGTQVTISPSDGYIAQKDSKGNITSIDFTGSSNTQQYIIKYYTDAEKSWEDQKIPNTVVVDPTPENPDNHDEVPVTTTVTVNGGSISKAVGMMTVSRDETTGELPWTVTLNIPASGLPKNFVIEDDLIKGWDGSSKDQWMTRDQIIKWATKLQWENGTVVPSGSYNVVFKASDGKEYTYQQIVENTALKNVKFTSFTITLPEGLTVPNETAMKLSFMYSSTVDLTKASPGTTKYLNYVKAGNKQTTQKYEYYKGGVVKTDGGGGTGTTKTSSEGELTWKVKITNDDKDTASLSITDTLPTGVVLDGISLSGWDFAELTMDESGAITGSGNQYQITGSYNAQSGVIDLKITNKTSGQMIQKKAEFTLTFNCHADSEALEGYEPGKTYTFKNTVEVKTDKGKLGSTDQTQEWTYTVPIVETKIVDKSGSWDNDNRLLNYSVMINPEGEDLVEGSDTMKLIDELTYSRMLRLYSPYVEAEMEVSLVRNRVKLYKAVKDADGKWSKGEELTNWSWNYGVKGNEDYSRSCVNTITAEGLPDNIPLILEYAYSVSSTIPEGRNMGLPISNTARLEGMSISDTDNQNHAQWEDQSSSGAITTEKTFTFYKVEKNNFGKGLEGAVFSVYEWNPETSAYEWLRDYTTDTEGQFKIQYKEGEDILYNHNTLYMVKETQAPEKYVMPDVVPEYYFYFSGAEGEENKLPETLPEGTVDLTKSAESAYVENIRNTTDITVKKIWKKQDGTELDYHGGGITVELYQKASTSTEATTLTGGIRLGAANSDKWLKEFNESMTAGTVIKFKITDLAPVGDPSLSFNGVSLGYETKEKIDITESWGWTHDGYMYTYSIMIQDGSNVLSGFVPSWEAAKWRWELLETKIPDTEDTLLETITLPGTDGWQHTFMELPKSVEQAGGGIIYYTYYVKELPVTNYITGYENNGGVNEGTITIINQAEKDPGHILPSTGGSGTTPYIIGGLLFTAAGILLLYKRRRGKEDIRFS